MPNFTFRLESLLRLRRAQRDDRRHELAQALRAEDILRRQCAQLDEEVAELRQQRATPTGTLNVDSLLDAARHEFVLRSQQQALEDQTVQVSAEIERRRQALLAADQQLRVLEKLRETRQQRHEAQEHGRELNRLDEAAHQRPQHSVTMEPH
jgi:flagellar export protein FliJ